MIDLDEIIAHASNLPPLPASTVRLAQLVGSGAADLQEVTEVVAFDQALTATLLRGANSVVSASATPVYSVSEAVMRLGTARVLALAVAKSTRSMLNAGMAGYDMREGQLWRHSVAAAVAAEVIPNYCDVELPPGAFTAAVLHDVGKLLMNRFLRADVVEFIHRAEKADHLERLEAEKVLLGVDHGELGGLMAQHWRLPDQIVLGIIYHHDPDAGNDIICDVTYLANLVAKNIEAGLDGRKGELSIHPSTAIRLGLRIPEIAQLCDSAATRYAQVCSRYNSA